MVHFSQCAEARSSPGYIMGVLCVVVFVDSVFYGLPVPFMPQLLQSLGVSTTGIGFLFASYSIACLIGALVSGYYIDDARSCRVVLFVSLFCFVGSAFLFAFCISFWLLVCARLLQGASSALTFTSGYALLALIFPSEKQGRVFGYLTTAMGVGVFAGPIFGSGLYTVSGGSKEFAFGVPATLLLLFSTLVVMMRPVEKTAESVPAETSQGGNLAALFRDPPLVMLTLTSLAYAGAATSLEPVLPLYLRDTLNSTPLGIGAMWSVFPVAQCVASPFVGHYCDKHIAWRGKITVAGLFSMSLSLLVLTGAHHQAVVVAAMVLLGVGLSGVYVPLIPEMTSRAVALYPNVPCGLVPGAANAMWCLGGFIGPLILSAIFPVCGFQVAMVIGASLLGVFTCLVAVSLRHGHPHVTSETNARLSEHDDVSLLEPARAENADIELEPDGALHQRVSHSAAISPTGVDRHTALV